MKLNPDKIVQEAAKRRLLNFSRYMMPKMATEPFHKVYYEVLDRFAHGKIKKLIVQMPPQHGKSQGSSRFLPAFMLGLNPDLKICIGSYAATIAQDFNRDVQRLIDSPEYHSVFPDTKINGSNVVTTGGYLRNSSVVECVGHKGCLRVVGRGGSLTSKTVDIQILDDVYKDDKEGNSPVVRDAAWNWYTTVVRTRQHNNSQELIVFTRWHAEDLIGKICEKEDVIDIKEWKDLDNVDPTTWLRINFQAIKEDEQTELDNREHNQPLWANRHSFQKLNALRKLDPNKFECLNQGNPSAAAGMLYGAFKTYTDKKEWGTLIRKGNYTDVADSGEDKLCSISYDIYKSGATIFNEQTHRLEPLLFALITDIVYTDKGTEYTEIAVPQMLNLHNTQVSFIESNNGGRQFKRSVEKKTRTTCIAFTQSKNKESRIITNSSAVNNQIIMPFDWKERYPDFYKDVTTFKKLFKANKHDDGTDVLTGIYERDLEKGSTAPYQQFGGGIVQVY